MRTFNTVPNHSKPLRINDILLHYHSVRGGYYKFRSCQSREFYLLWAGVRSVRVERTNPTPFSGMVVVGYYETGSSQGQRSGIPPPTDKQQQERRRTWALALTVLLALVALLTGNAIFQQIVNYADCGGGGGVWNQWDLPPPRRGEPPPM